MKVNHLKMAAWWAEQLDNKFSIGKFGFGLDPIINIVPVIGPVVAFGLSLYLLWIARDLYTPPEIKRKMLSNLVIDLAISSVPVVGTIGDFFFKANLRNLRLLEEWAQSQPIEGQIVSSKRMSLGHA